jgi:methylthioribose-1-phosphate isomerase
MKEVFDFNAVIYRLDEKKLVLLDQTLLPTEERFIEISSEDSLIEAIKSLRVRGAPAIGIAGAFGMAMLIENYSALSFLGLYNEFKRLKNALIKSRPTAVNLSNNLCRMERVILELKEEELYKIKMRLLEEASIIRDEDIAANVKMAEYGLEYIQPGSAVMTYCNAGHLAVSKYGTALSPIYLAHEKGYDITVYVCETRPFLQGSRLTAYELMKAGVRTVLICDNMAASVLSHGEVSLFVTGCDRIALNGDTANKIGTSTVSICAAHYGVPHVVIGPESTIDRKCETGNDIEIEYRRGDEITDMWFNRTMAPENTEVSNPAFDVTSSNLISAIITENGVYKYPYNFKRND